MIGNAAQSQQVNQAGIVQFPITTSPHVRPAPLPVVDRLTSEYIPGNQQQAERRIFWRATEAFDSEPGKGRVHVYQFSTKCADVGEFGCSPVPGAIQFYQLSVPQHESWRHPLMERLGRALQIVVLVINHLCVSWRGFCDQPSRENSGCTGALDFYFWSLAPGGVSNAA